MSMGPPSVLPADPEEECLLGAPGAAARQLEREYDEAEVEMNEALRDNVDENAVSVGEKAALGVGCQKVAIQRNEN